MHSLWIGLMALAAAINLAPVVGVASADRMAALYGVTLDDPNLQILMRHRAVLFGLVGGLLLAAAFYPPLRTAAYAIGFGSMLSFLLIAWMVGGYDPPIQRVVIADLVGIAALSGAVAIDLWWLHPAAAGAVQ